MTNLRDKLTAALLDSSWAKVALERSAAEALSVPMARVTEFPVTLMQSEGFRESRSRKFATWRKGEDHAVTTCRNWARSNPSMQFRLDREPQANGQPQFSLFVTL